MRKSSTYHGDGIDKDRNEDTPTCALKHHRNELVAPRRLGRQSRKEFGSMHESVPEQTHESNFFGMHEDEISQAVLDQPARRISGRDFLFLSTKAHVLLLPLTRISLSEEEQGYNAQAI